MLGVVICDVVMIMIVRMDEDSQTRKCLRKRRRCRPDSKDGDGDGRNIRISISDSSWHRRFSFTRSSLYFCLVWLVSRSILLTGHGQFVRASVTPTRVTGYASRSRSHNNKMPLHGGLSSFLSESHYMDLPWNRKIFARN